MRGWVWDRERGDKGVLRGRDATVALGLKLSEWR